MNKQQAQEVLNFIREHRSNEANFKKLYQKLEEELANKHNSEEYKKDLSEIKEKYAKEFVQSKEGGVGAWPEFEHFITEFEKALTKVLHSE